MTISLPSTVNDESRIQSLFPLCISIARPVCNPAVVEVEFFSLVNLIGYFSFHVSLVRFLFFLSIPSWCRILQFINSVENAYWLNVLEMIGWISMKQLLFFPRLTNYQQKSSLVLFLFCLSAAVGCFYFHLDLDCIKGFFFFGKIFMICCCFTADLLKEHVDPPTLPGELWTCWKCSSREIWLQFDLLLLKSVYTILFQKLIFSVYCLIELIFHSEWVVVWQICETQVFSFE